MRERPCEQLEVVELPAEGELQAGVVFRIDTAAAPPHRSVRLAEAEDDVVDGLPDGGEVLEVVVVDAETDGALAEVLFERLDQLDQRERVGVERREARVERDGVLVDLEDLGEPLAHEREHLVGTDRTALLMGLSRHWRSPP